MARPSHKPASAPPAKATKPRIAPAAILIVLACGVAYIGSFSGTLIFDDNVAILKNPTIEDLWSLEIFRPRNDGSPASGRPLVNASLALSAAVNRNMALHDYPQAGHHLLNLLVHTLAGLALFGLVRRTLLLERLKGRFGPHATVLALAVALLWVLHPLQTESVTYISQRAESIMGLFFLLTLYCWLRAATREAGPARHGNLWLAAAAISCTAGMACKEVMAAAPLVVLLYDRLLLSGSWRETFRLRWRGHLAIACTWVVLGLLVWNTGSRNGTAGFGTALLLDPMQYALNQGNVILRYLQLSVLPVGLCLDYYWQPAKGVLELLPGLVVVGSLLGVTVWAVVRGRSWGILGAAFFLVLAPTSSFMPLRDLAFEHRMYLPLAAVVAAATLGLYSLAPRRFARALLCVLAPAAVFLAAMTYQRNEDYRSELAIWRNALQWNADNPRANLVYAMELSRNPATIKEAERHYEKATLKDPLGRYGVDQVKAYNNRGLMYLNQRKYQQAADDFAVVTEQSPDFAAAWGNLAYARMQLGQLSQALADATKALDLKPERNLEAGIYDTRGLTHYRLDDFAKAEADLTRAVELGKPGHPDLKEFYANRARTYLKLQQFDNARADAAACLRLRGRLEPDLAKALGMK